MPKPWPEWKTDEEAEHFVATADLTEYDVSALRRVRFVFDPALDKRVSLKMSTTLLAAVKERAAAAGIPYQRFVRNALEAAVARPEGSRP